MAKVRSKQAFGVADVDAGDAVVVGLAETQLVRPESG